MAWRTVKMCSNCPFANSGPGLHLRKTLSRGRWKEILDSIRHDHSFFCHATVEYDDETGEGINGTGLVCAGSIQWERKHGFASQMVRIGERIDAIRMRSRK